MGPFLKGDLIHKHFQKGKDTELKLKKLPLNHTLQDNSDLFCQMLFTPALLFFSLLSRATRKRKVFYFLFSMLASLNAQFISILIYLFQHMGRTCDLRRNRIKFSMMLKQTFHFVDKMLLQSPVMFYVVSFFSLAFQSYSSNSGLKLKQEENIWKGTLNSYITVFLILAAKSTQLVSFWNNQCLRFTLEQLIGLSIST